jgi:hypothetical protein
MRASARLIRVGYKVWGLRGMDYRELMDGLELPDMPYLW